MSSISISLITVTYNAAATLEKTIISVIAQNYPHLQYIIVDGASTDGTLEIINKYKQHISHIISEPDKGHFDAMNKGLSIATGDVIGMLNADDHFAGNDILQQIANAFRSSDTDIIYGDIDYINKQGGAVRKWRSGEYERSKFNWGWMPPHPTFYAKSTCFERYGNYDLGYGSSGDYELMLRFLYKYRLRAEYVKLLKVKMLVGGIGNRNFGNRVKAWKHDRRAMAANGVRMPLLAVFFKPLRKIFQYFS